MGQSIVKIIIWLIFQIKWSIKFKSKTNKRFKYKIKPDLSSPRSAFSVATRSSDLSRLCVTPGDPRQRVDSRLITVEMLGLLLASGVAVSVPGVLERELPRGGDPALDRRSSKSSTRPLAASGAGSTPRRV